MFRLLKFWKRQSVIQWYYCHNDAPLLVSKGIVENLLILKIILVNASMPDFLWAGIKTGDLTKWAILGFCTVLIVSVSGSQRF